MATGTCRFIQTGLALQLHNLFTCNGQQNGSVAYSTLLLPVARCRLLHAKNKQKKKEKKISTASELCCSSACCSHALKTEIVSASWCFLIQFFLFLLAAHFGGPQPHNLPRQRGERAGSWLRPGPATITHQKGASNSLSYAGIDANCVACYKMHAGDNKQRQQQQTNQLPQCIPNLQECEEAKIT